MPRQKGAKLQHTGHKGIHMLPDGRYQIRFTAVEPKTGKMKYRQCILCAGTTLGQAVDELLRRQGALRLQEEEEKKKAPERRMTLRDYALQWLAQRAQASSYTHRTREAHAHILAHHILPRLGDHYLDSLTRADIGQWVAWSNARRQRIPSSRKFPSEEARKRAQLAMPLCSHATRRGWWRVLTNMLRDAYADGLLAQDVTYRLQGPVALPGDKEQRELRTLSSDQLSRLLGALHRNYPSRYAEVVVLGVTGMRSGELWALHWDALELDANKGGRIHVRASVQNRHELGRTKTKAAREVPIPGWVCAILQEHRRSMIADQAPGVGQGIVFPSREGEYRIRGSLRKALEGACKSARLEQKVTPQVLRRTFNTLMVAAGVDRIVLRAMMGHCSEEMTAHYAGVDLRHKTQALTALGLGLRGPEGAD